MTPEEFEQLVSQNEDLAGPIRAAAAAVATRPRETLGTPTEIASIAVLFPVVVYIVREIGLPWLYETKRYSELWRIKFHNWVNKQYLEHGLDPDVAKAAGEVLRRDLEAIKDASVRKAWERFVELLVKTVQDQ